MSPEGRRHHRKLYFSYQVSSCKETSVLTQKVQVELRNSRVAQAEGPMITQGQGSLAGLSS